MTENHETQPEASSEQLMEVDAKYNARDIAAKLLEECRYRVGSLKMHKLLYYCQGWHLALMPNPSNRGERNTLFPMFKENIEAWELGPVVADYWRELDRGLDIEKQEIEDIKTLNVLRIVIANYGHISGALLSRASHAELPWKKAYEINEAGNEIISLQEMSGWFRGNTMYPTFWEAVHSRREITVKKSPTYAKRVRL